MYVHLHDALSSHLAMDHLIRCLQPLLFQVLRILCQQHHHPLLQWLMIPQRLVSFQD